MSYLFGGSPFDGYAADGRRSLNDSGGGGGGSSQPTQTTAYNTNIPEYAKPYVETMLGAAQKQVFQGGDAASGFTPYTPYSTDPTKYVAGFSPLQQQAQSAAANMAVPSEYAAATGLAGTAAGGSLGLARQMAGAGQRYAQQATDPNSIAAYMSPYQQQVTDYQKQQAARDYQIASQARQAQAVGQGAFGGSRQAIQESEAQRALMSQLQGIQATGSQQAFQNAQQAQQYAANLGLQGQQAGLQGLGQALSAAGTIGQLGTSGLAAQQNIANLQNTMGAQQQAQQQQIINQDIQNYATAQQYPYMQLSTLSSLLRGLPLQSTTTQSYQAMPSTAQQVAGLGLTGIGAAKALSGFKAGGEVKGLATGGNEGREMSGGVEGALGAKLQSMNDQELQQVIGSTQSPRLRAMAEQVLAEHHIRDAAEKRAEQAIAAERAPKPQIPQQAPAGLAAAPAPNMDTMNAATGGIVAFAGDDEETGSLVQEDPFAGLDEKTRAIAQRQMGLQRAFGVKENIYDPYKQFLTDKAAGLSKEKDYVQGMGLMDLGSRVASTPGPWGSALAQSIQGALPGFQKGIADYKKQEADVYKAQTDVAKAENDLALGKADKTEKAYEALQKEENDFKRTQMQVEGQIRAAGINASRPTDLMQNYQIQLEKLTGGDASKATPAMKAAAMNTAAEQLRGQPSQKIDAANLKNAYNAVAKSEQDGQLAQIKFQMLQAKKDPKKLEALQSQYDNTRATIMNDFLYGPQTATPAPGAGGGGGRIKVDAQGNIIS